MSVLVWVLHRNINNRGEKESHRKELSRAIMQEKTNVRLRDRQAKRNSPSHFLLRRLEEARHVGEATWLLSLLTQILISSRHILTDTPGIMFNQMFGHPVARQVDT